MVDMPAFTPTLNPSPIKREGLQNVVLFPFPHFGGKGPGMGASSRIHAIRHSPIKRMLTAD